MHALRDDSDLCRVHAHGFMPERFQSDSQQSSESTALEIAIIIDAAAPTQELANTVCSFARSTLLHYGYPGRVSTAGNLAFPFSPSDIKMGDVYEFNVYHLIKPKDPNEFFPVEIKIFEEGEL